MPNFYPSRINHVQTGSPVSAGNTSRSTRQLESRTAYIKQIVDAIEAGRLIVRREQKLASDVLEGHAVYWNDDNKQFERAIGAVSTSITTGSLESSVTSDVIGVVVVKHNSVSGDIALMGMVEFTPDQIENMTGSVIAAAGRYYLSGVAEGQLIHQRPPVSVPVAFILGPSDDCETNSWVLINPQTRDFLEDHIHYQIELTALPAGDHVPPSTDEPHEILNADVSLPGWLPAGHASFGGKAPSGAAFGYNMAAHSELEQLWPPIPTNACVLEVRKPDVLAQFQGAVRALSEHVTFTQHGIWWMTSCYDEVPWPTDLDTTLSASSSVSSASASASASSSAAEETCPPVETMRLILSFIKMTFATDRSVVTSLQPDEGQPLEYVNCNGEPASTGDLKSRLNLETLVVDESYGGQVFKEINSPFTFGRGWVAEGLVEGSEEVILSGTRTRLLDPTAPASISNPTVHQGIVTVNVQLDPTDRELNPQIVRLGDALEREYRSMDYTGFPEGRDSAIRMRYNIPPSGLPAIPKFKIRAIMFGLAAGPWSAMTMQYRRITRPTTGTPTPVVDSWTTLTFDVVTPSDDYDGLGTDLPAGELIEIESDSFTIAAGEIVLVELMRAASAIPVFSADIGVLRIGGITFAGT